MSENTSESWLQRLKDESWEAELLVAAVSIIGTLQLFAFVEWINGLFINILPPSFYFAAYFVVFSALLAISILSSMFIIHFMLRAYWVGLVGLNSVFSDYDIDASKYSKIYMNKLVNALPTLDHYINRADRLCSVIFSAAFGFLMAYGWIFVSSALYLVIANRLVNIIPLYVIVAPLALLALATIAQMFLTVFCNIKRNKDNEKLQTMFYRVSMFITIISFGPLYKAIMQISVIFSTNFKKDKALVKLVLFFVLCGFCLAGVRLLNTNILYLMHPDKYFSTSHAEASYYQNQMIGETFLLSPQLTNNVIKSPLIEMFIPIFSYEQGLHKQNCENLRNMEGEEREKRRAAELSCYKQYHEIVIDGKSIPFHMIKTEHNLTGQDGVVVYAELTKEMKNGYYVVEVQKSIFDEPQSWSIPFYYLRLQHMSQQ
jgi:hypothetical protein